MDIKYSLHREMLKDSTVISYLGDETIARTFYSALCNMQWAKIKDMPQDELIVNVLKGTHLDVCSYSWRSAGAIIAEIRSAHYNVDEDYMDFYCLGNEGHVTDLVKECFRRMGWKAVAYD